MAEGLRAAFKVVEEFQRILMPCFGPYGKDVLMRSDTGTMYLSKEGEFVLQHLEIKHPMGRLIKETVSNYYSATGDFSKTFIILLSCFLRHLSKQYIESNSSRTIDQISSVLSGISISLLSIKTHLNEEMLVNKLITKLLKPSAFFNDGYIDQLLETSFFGKVSYPSRAIFLQIVNSIVQHQHFTCESLDYVVTHFEDICIPVHGIPFDQSKVLDGCIIQRDSKTTKFNMVDVRFVLISGDLNRNHKDDVYKMKPETNTLKQLNVFELRFHGQVVEVLQRHNVGIVFVEEVLPKDLERMFVDSSIIVVNHVLVEDLERLSRRYNASFLSGLQDVFSLENSPFSSSIGQASFIRSIVVGKSKACHVGPRTHTPMSNGSMNVQIILCSISLGLQVQYQKLLHNSFKVLKQAYHKQSKQFILVPAGGTFELQISKLLADFSAVCSDDTERTVAKFLSKSFLEIPRLIFEKSAKTCNTKRILLGFPNDERLDGSTKSVNVETGELVDASAVDCYEPFISKLKLLFLLLEFSSQIVKIQNVIPVTKRILNVSSDDEELEDCI